MEYVASTIERLMQKPGDRAYVISTYVIGKEKILLEVGLCGLFRRQPVRRPCSDFAAAAHPLRL